MKTKQPKSTRSLAARVSLLTLLGSLAASAQSPPTQPKSFQQLEQEISELKRTIEELRQANTNRAVTNVSTATTSASRTNDPIARIRDEGLNHSQVMETLSYLTDVIGPRLTASPNMKRANEWTRDKLTSWGMSNARLESWGPFGRGWTVKRFSAQIVEPQSIHLAGYPKAWSSGFEKPLVAEVIHVDVKSEAELEPFRGKLKGAIVLNGPVRDVKARFDLLAARMNETNLLRLANADPPRPRAVAPRQATNRMDKSNISTNPPSPAAASNRVDTASGPPRGGGGQTNLQARILWFLAKEGAAAIVSPSGNGDGGTYFVMGASVPLPPDRDTNSPAPRAWWTNAPAIPPQLVLAVEDYNRLARMLKLGEKLKMEVDLQIEYQTRDLMGYNTVAEIPGSDKKGELVMLGAHLDSWHSGTGATDNGAGVAATMEAMRILKALDFKPKRTIRIGLWTGEEQGLYGSEAYVSNHFGYYKPAATNDTASARRRRNTARAGAGTNTAPDRVLMRGADYEKLSAYFNLDNGTGKIRGVYLQGNESVRPLFRKWLKPFADLGAETLTPSNTGGTDHTSFDDIGLPGFQFIQDPIEYSTRTHHSNEDVFDRIQADDMKQAASILAAFAYEAAMMEERLPRKSVE